MKSKQYPTIRIVRKGVFKMTPEGTILVPEECEVVEYTGPLAKCVAFLYTPPFGVPGDISRPNAPYVAEAQALNSATPFSSFGVPGQMVSNFFVPITGTGQAPYGLLVRPYPAQGQNASDPIGTAVPITSGPCTVLRKGYASVFAQLGTPALGAQVYIRFQSPSGNQIIGGLEQGTTANNYAWTGAQWMGPPDAAGNAEISFGNTTV